MKFRIYVLKYMNKVWNVDGKKYSKYIYVVAYSFARVIKRDFSKKWIKVVIDTCKTLFTSLLIVTRAFLPRWVEEVEIIRKILRWRRLDCFISDVIRPTHKLDTNGIPVKPSYKVGDYFILSLLYNVKKVNNYIWKKLHMERI